MPAALAAASQPLQLLRRALAPLAAPRGVKSVAPGDVSTQGTGRLASIQGVKQSDERFLQTSKLKMIIIELKLIKQ